MNKRNLLLPDPETRKSKVQASAKSVSGERWLLTEGTCSLSPHKEPGQTHVFLPRTSFHSRPTINLLIDSSRALKTSQTSLLEGASPSSFLEAAFGITHFFPTAGGKQVTSPQAASVKTAGASTYIHTVQIHGSLLSDQQDPSDLQRDLRPHVGGRLPVQLSSFLGRCDHSV